MALGPAIGLVVITSLFFNLELRTWYGGAVREAVVNSNIVARDYENEIHSELISDTQLITREIIKVSRNNEVITTTPIAGPRAIAVNKLTNLIYRRDSSIFFFL